MGGGWETVQSAAATNWGCMGGNCLAVGSGLWGSLMPPWTEKGGSGLAEISHRYLECDLVLFLFSTVSKVPHWREGSFPLSLLKVQLLLSVRCPGVREEPRVTCVSDLCSPGSRQWVRLQKPHPLASPQAGWGVLSEPLRGSSAYLSAYWCLLITAVCVPEQELFG